MDHVNYYSRLPITLYRDKSLRSVLLVNRNLRAFLLYRERLASLPWAVYRVLLQWEHRLHLRLLYLGRCR